MLVNIISLLSFSSLLISSVAAYSAVFNISSGDVPALIAAINAANANAEENTINLEPGTYSLTAADNIVGQPTTLAESANGMPVITGNITINGDLAETTIIERTLNAVKFRIFDVAGGARLTVNDLTVSGGAVFNPGAGARVRAGGTLTLNRSIIEKNQAIALSGVGGGISNGGVLSINQSSIRNNRGDSDREGGGLFNGGTATIDNSVISQNIGALIGGGIRNGGTMTITNTTIAHNRAHFGAGLDNSGMLIIKNSTISENNGIVTAEGGLSAPNGGGISNTGTLQLQNSILALNTASDPHFGPGRGPDCLTFESLITSLGNNIMGDLSDCSINLHPTDRIGAPGLGAFIDDGAP